MVGMREGPNGTLVLSAILPSGGTTGGIVQTDQGNIFQVVSGTMIIGPTPATLPVAGALVFGVVPATANAFQITDQTNAYYAVDTRIATSGVAGHTFTTTAPSFASATTSNFKIVNIPAYTWTVTGGTNITTTNPGALSLNIGAPTLTSTSATTAAVLSTVTVNGPLAAGAGPVTATNAQALDFPTWTATNETTASSIRINPPTGGATNNFALNFAAASNLGVQSNTASALVIQNQTPAAYYTLDTRTGVTGVLTHAFANAAPSFASAAGSAYSLVSIGSFTWTVTGGSAITTTNPGALSLLISAPTITSTSATTAAVVSTVTINGPLAAGAGPVTATNAQAIDIPTWTATNETTASGIRIAPPTGGATNNFAINFAAASNLGVLSNTASALVIQNQTPAAYYTLNTQTGTDNVVAHSFAVVNLSYAGAGASTFSLLNLAAFTQTYTGTTTVTAAEGLMLTVNSPTISYSGQTVTQASVAQVNGPIISAGTLTTGISVHLLNPGASGGTFTSHVGIKVDALSRAATNNVALWVQNPIQVGSASITTNNQIHTASQGAASTTLYIGNGSINVTSDVRLKTDITPTRLNALELAKQLRIVDFAWNDPSDRNDKFPNGERNRRGLYTGIIAQEAINVLPWIVNAPDRDCPICRAGQACYRHDSPWFVEYEHAVPLLFKGLQETATKFDAMDERLGALNARVEALAK